jgi:hypothetical protein
MVNYYKNKTEMRVNTLTFNETNYTLIFESEGSSAGRDLSVTNNYYSIYKNGIKLPYEISLYNKWDIETNEKTLGITIENHINVLFHKELDSFDIDMDLMLWIISNIESL